MYQLIKDSNSIKRIADGASIPADPANSDYAAYLAWVDAGNTPEPVEIPVTLPPTLVSRRQARQALALAGKLHLIQPAIDSLQDPLQRALAQIEWDDSAEFQRNWPLLTQLAAAVGISPEEIDDLFILANSL